MPTSKKKDMQTPCDDWENQEYDDPIPDSTPPNHSNADKLPSTSSPSIDQDNDASSNVASKPSLDPIESENSALWNEANRNPKYVVLPANASHSAVTANRPLVQETMFGKSKVTILKRPKADSLTNPTTTTTTANNASNSSAMSVSLREKAYQEARERIFGGSVTSSTSDDQPSSSSKSLKSNSSQNLSDPSPVTIQRQPNGPVALDQKGFSNRQKSVST